MLQVVASFAEAWIEINLSKIFARSHHLVASFAEAWIEINGNYTNTVKVFVASFAEAWIEILILSSLKVALQGRLLRGGVD